MSDTLPFRQPYEKPLLTAIDLGNLMDEIDKGEGEVYRRFSDLADKAEAYFDGLVAFEVELQSISELRDEVAAKLAKLQAVTEIRERDAETHRALEATKGENDGR